jgi:hypothetical protein
VNYNLKEDAFQDDVHIPWLVEQHTISADPLNTVWIVALRMRLVERPRFEDFCRLASGFGAEGAPPHLPRPRPRPSWKPFRGHLYYRRFYLDARCFHALPQHAARKGARMNASGSMETVASRAPGQTKRGKSRRSRARGLRTSTGWSVVPEFPVQR